MKTDPYHQRLSFFMMSSSKKKLKVDRSLARVILHYVLGIYCIIAISFTALQIFLDYQNEVKHLTKQVDEFAQVMLPVLSSAVWDLDQEQIELTMEGAIHYQYIIGANLKGPSELPQFNKGYVNNSNNKTTSNNDEKSINYQELKNKSYVGRNIFFKIYEFNYPIQYDHDGELTELGSVTLYSSSDTIISRVANNAIVTAINAVFKTFFLWAIFVIILTRYVTTPLTQLTKAVSMIDLRHSNPQNISKDLLADANIISTSDELGVLVHSFVTMADELDNQRSQIYEYQNDLEDKVESRTKELNIALKVKDDFLSTMSHEIRTPMNGVLGMTELLRNTKLDHEQFHYVSTITQSGEALLTVINNILDFSKIEADKLEIESVHFSLEETLDESINILSSTANRKGLQIFEDFQINLPTHLIGDPMRIRQVLLNLLGNALKFTKNGYILLKASQLNIENNRYVTYRIDIIDTGIGINETNISTLFQPYIQANSSTTRHHGGTGLGLSICKRLVNLMGGEIGVVSTPSVGSNFWFTIKLMLTKPENNEKQLETTKKLQLLQSKRVLIVDNDANFCETTKNCLHAWSIQSNYTQSSENGWLELKTAYQQNTPYDIVLIDNTLADIDNNPLARKILDDPIVKKTRIVLLTSFQQNPKNIDLANMSTVCTIEKPITSGRLLNTLRFVLSEIEDVNHTNDFSEKFSFEKLRVLVAEDNQVNQLVIKGLLNHLKISPTFVNNGADALKISESGWDIIFMDCNMPVMDGYEACKRIRDNEQLTDAKPVVIIGLSAHAMNTAQQKALDVGMNDYLTKPVNTQSLINILLKYKRAL